MNLVYIALEREDAETYLEHLKEFEYDDLSPAARHLHDALTCATA